MGAASDSNGYSPPLIDDEGGGESMRDTGRDMVMSCKSHTTQELVRD